MNRCVLPLIIGSLLLPLGCGGNDEPTGLDEPLVLQPTELCSDNPVTAIATFEDANLEAAVRIALGIGSEPLTCGLVSGLTELRATTLASLVGIQNLTSLTTLWLPENNSISDISALSGLTSLGNLDLRGNSISDISALSGLTSLTFLQLGFNSITDISALSGLTSLETLFLDINSITDISALSGLTSLFFLTLDDNPDLSNIQPLLDNTGLGAGDTVTLTSTSVSCADVAALKAKGVTVTSDCP